MGICAIMNIRALNYATSYFTKILCVILPKNRKKVKNIIKTTILSLPILTSCVSTKVSFENNYDFSVLKPTSEYTIQTKDGNKIKAFQLTKIKDNEIIGNVENKEIIVPKTTINKVLKFSAGKTIPLVLAVIGVAIITPAYVNNKAIGQ